MTTPGFRFTLFTWCEALHCCKGSDVLYGEEKNVLLSSLEIINKGSTEKKSLRKNKKINKSFSEDYHEGSYRNNVTN